MSFWSSSNLETVTAGRWLHPATGTSVWCGVSIDSRAVQKGQVFVALSGERFNGHDFLDDAAGAGAACLIVDEAVDRTTFPAPTLLVQNTVDALNRLAAAYRDDLAAAGTLVISVSGSNGKTTTRHLIHSVLCARHRGTQSPRSFNNRIGVPLTLLAASTEDDFVVVEIGTNHPGEVADLAAVVRPDAAVVTSIGQEHLEFFETLEAVAEEEASVLGYVARNGLAVIPASGPGTGWLQDAAPGEGSVVRVGRDIRCAQVSPHRVDAPTRVALEDGLAFDLPLPGEHNVQNALAAVAVGRWMKVDERSIAAALGRVSGLPMRTQVVRYGSGPDGVTVINDAYNANPDSVQAAIELLNSELSARDDGGCAVILGDMLELGDAGPPAHDAVAGVLARLGSRLRTVVLVGPLSVGAADELRRRCPRIEVQTCAKWSDELPARVAALLRPGDLVLIKGSRGIGLERLVPCIEERFGGAICSVAK